MSHCVWEWLELDIIKTRKKERKKERKKKKKRKRERERKKERKVKVCKQTIESDCHFSCRYDSDTITKHLSKLSKKHQTMIYTQIDLKLFSRIR